MTTAPDTEQPGVQQRQRTFSWSDPAAIAALNRAAATTQGLRKLAAETRDLFRRPLRTHELDAFDAALIDPPRAGALDQARATAASALPLVVSISCNAATFARDARVLIGDDDIRGLDGLATPVQPGMDIIIAMAMSGG